MKIGSALSVIQAVLLIAVVGGAHALEGAPPPPKPEQPKSDPAAPERGTEKSPLFIRADVAAKKTDAESRAEEKERLEKREIDLTTVKYAGWAVGIAAFAFLIACVQLFMFWRQLHYMRTAVDDAADVAKAAKKSADLARQEFVAAHRPKMVVRKLAWIMGDNRLPIGVGYSISNVGDGPGTVIAISALVWQQAGEGPPLLPDYLPPGELSRTLNSGERIPMQHFIPDPLQNEVAFLYGYKRVGAESKIFFFGYVDYIDGDGRKRQTGFLRQFNFDTERFVPIPDPDYEYQD